ncbi:NUDIX hydrolase [Pelagibius sp. Alg239-R121]|uniref:NUDIX hydrolase n=1 Tax=Pelagibius sp. Alg239-R121 TaxID=2993448 RepID=UPI0024A73C3E|nr:NUDIX hydrolase [Pelagibius sp. Alg239-R121]
MALKYTESRRLTWARQLQALAQTGLTFASDPYDIERYQAARALAVEMLAAIGEADAHAVTALFDGETGYATPKVDVRGVVIRDERILLVKEITDGKWALPGGWADVNASPSENVEREIFEESGYRARVTKLAAVYDRLKHPHEPPHPFHIYKMFFICELLGGDARPSVETSEVGFFEATDLPELSRGRVLEAQISRMFEHHRNPALATDFD